MTVNAISEIKDKRVFDNFYNACMKEKSSEFTYDEFSIYCSCTAKKVMKNFTVQNMLKSHQEKILLSQYYVGLQ